MKTLLVVATLLSFNAFADHHEEMKGKSFDEKKSMMSQHLDKRISELNDAKSCVTAATDEAGLKACHAKMKQMHDAHKAEWKAKKASKMKK